MNLEENLKKLGESMAEASRQAVSSLQRFSGKARKQFPTGAVRDMAAGKGRYDLLPWAAIEELAKHCERGALSYGERNCEKGIPLSSLIDSAIRHLSKYMQGQDDEPHLVAAMWNIAFAVWTEKQKPEMQDIPTRRCQGGP